MTLIYADTSLLVSRYFFAFAHTFNHCHLERPRASLRCERESKDPEYASLLNAASRRSHENVSRELPVLASTRRSPWRFRPSSTVTFLSTSTALRWMTGTGPVGSVTSGRNISVLTARNQSPRRRLLIKKKSPVPATELSQVQNRYLELNQIRRAVQLMRAGLLLVTDWRWEAFYGTLLVTTLELSVFHKAR